MLSTDTVSKAHVHTTWTKKEKQDQVDTNSKQNIHENILYIHEILSSPPIGETAVASAENTN
jgi:hypothetical protein